MSASINLTEAAIQSAKQLAATNQDFFGKNLRLYLAGKGCDGFDYGVTFDEWQEGDHVIDVADDLKLLCDARTIEFVDGTSIDWVDDERGQGFLINNPSHRKFRGKFYKKEIWRKKLEAFGSP